MAEDAMLDWELWTRNDIGCETLAAEVVAVAGASRALRLAAALKRCAAKEIGRQGQAYGLQQWQTEQK